MISRDELRASRERGHGYLLERGLFRRRSTGEVAHPSFVALSFPLFYQYDVLRALEYFRAADVRDDRMADAVRIVRDKRTTDGRWVLDATRTDGLTVPFDEVVGGPSRWTTLRALRVLRWYETV